MARGVDPLAGRTADLVTTWPQVCGWRLARQHVTEPADDAVAVAARLCGVHAQVASSAQFTVRRRSPATAADCDAALWTDRTLVRTWAMRGTLHWLPADEYTLWTAALSTREWRITPGWERYHGVTADELAAVTAAIPEALAGRCLTRDELAARLVDVTGLRHLDAQLRSGWGAVLKPAANRGLLCSGPTRNGAATFVRPDEWLGEVGPAPDPDTALRAVLHRFLDAYGPATHDDVARWFGERPAMGRRLVAAHADELVVVDVDGHRAWLTAEGATTLPEAPAAEGVELLGGFDPYVLAPISHRDAIVPHGSIGQVSRAAGWISAVVLVDGMVAATWTTEPAAGGGVLLAVVPLMALTHGQITRIERLAAALGGDLLPAPVNVDVRAT